jgi:hypothetical protein
MPIESAEDLDLFGVIADELYRHEALAREQIQAGDQGLACRNQLCARG